MRVTIKETWKNKPIRVYKAKSRGLLLGEYSCYTEFLELENKIYKPTSTIKTRREVIRTNIHLCLTGELKSMHSDHFDCRVAIKQVKNERITNQPAYSGNN